MVKAHTPQTAWSHRAVLRHRVKVKDTGLFETENFTGIRLLLREICSTAVSKVLRTTTARFRELPPRPSYKSSPQPWASNKQPKSCPLCQLAGCNDQHFLSACSYLHLEDRTYLSYFRLTSALDDEEPDYTKYTPSPFLDEDDHSSCASARTVSRRVNTKQSLHFKAFRKHHPLRLTLDTGTETSMIKSSMARSIGAPIKQSSQQALQADRVTPLAVAGEFTSSYPEQTNNSLLMPLLLTT